MFRRKTKTPDPASNSESLPPIPQSSETIVISKDALIQSNEAQPEIKSVGLSLQPPTVKPQQAEIHNGQLSPDTSFHNEVSVQEKDRRSRDSGIMHNYADASEMDIGRVATPHVGAHSSGGIAEENEFNGVQLPPDSEETPAASPKAGRSRSKTESKAKSRSKVGTLSAISEVPSSAERTRPSTGAKLTKMNSRMGFEADFGSGEAASPKPGTKSKPGGAAMEKNNSPPSPKKVVVSKKKLVQVDPPVKPKVQVDPPVKPKVSNDGLTVKKPKQKLPKEAIASEEYGDSSVEHESNVESLGVGDALPTTTSDEVGKEESSVSFNSVEESPSQEELLENDDLNEGESNQLLEKQTVPKQLHHQKEKPSKKRIGSASSKETRPNTVKSSTPPSALKRQASARAGRGISERTQRRIRMKLENDGFSAMGLMDPEETTDATGPKNPKKTFNEPPPPHYAMPTTAATRSKKISAGSPNPTAVGSKSQVLKDKQPAISRNPTRRRAAIKKMESTTQSFRDRDEDWLRQPFPNDERGSRLEYEGYQDRIMSQPYARSRMYQNDGDGDFFDGASAMPRQRFLSNYRHDDGNDYSVRELEDGGGDGRINLHQPGYFGETADDVISTQGYRYSDRIADKYRPKEDMLSGQLGPNERYMLSSSAIQSAERKGVVSPRTVDYLSNFMVKAKPLERSESQTLASKPAVSKSQRNHGPPKPFSTKLSAPLARDSIMNDDAPPPPPPKFTAKKKDALKTSSLQNLRGSIMNDSKDGTKAGTKVDTLSRTKSIMDDHQPPLEESGKSVKVTGNPRNIRSMNESKGHQDDYYDGRRFEREDRYYDDEPYDGRFRENEMTELSSTQPRLRNSRMQKPFVPKTKPKSATSKTATAGNTISPAQSFWSNPSQWPMPYNPIFGAGFGAAFPGTMSYAPAATFPEATSTSKPASGLPTYTPSLPGVGSMRHQGLGIPSVPPSLVPARLRLTQIPVVTYRQSYVIEPTGHPPGTYLAPEELGMDASGGLLTYISAGAYPGSGMMVGNGLQEGQRGLLEEPDISQAAVKPIGAKKAATVVKKVAATTGVRSMIQKGVIGRR